ncbi:replication protein A 70 kDa DNA-binding subunit isoform X2 [Folsomia candida]|uniref:replication protein A 70 kDa DNA-binding subunit isoform X2 n=1 Tax=Folsomia candida TaxID=158441 RepID=UPI00160537DB|nr:replication protein A 70 kDa DNA-binding subunit isoform X2 [Folsomia candida]
MTVNIPHQLEMKFLPRIRDLQHQFVILIRILAVKFYSNVLLRASRVTSKSPINTWSNSRRSGKLFKIDLLDDSGEIRMTAFNQQVDELYDFVKVGCVYTFRNFGVKEANKKFVMLKNDYELIATQNTKLARCTDPSNIPVVSFDFMKIANIEQAEKDKVIDVIGVCKKLGDVQTFTAKTTGRQVTKRDITLVDKTKQINLTLWGKQAEDFRDDDNPVVAVKRVKVSDFNGKSISCTMASTILLNPDLPEAQTLREWYDDDDDVTTQIGSH